MTKSEETGLPCPAARNDKRVCGVSVSGALTVLDEGAKVVA